VAAVQRKSAIAATECDLLVFGQQLPRFGRMNFAQDFLDSSFKRNG